MIGMEQARELVASALEKAAEEVAIDGAMGEVEGWDSPALPTWRPCSPSTEAYAAQQASEGPGLRANTPRHANLRAS
jgi:hypothetical protein